MSLNLHESACAYAALILQDEGLEITADKLSLLLTAANVEVESIWPSIFEKALKDKDLGALLFSIGATPASAPTGATAATTSGATTAAVVEEKVEEKEESDEDMGFGLFD
jgi:large subunit ribosomal protein LP1